MGTQLCPPATRRATTSPSSASSGQRCAPPTWPWTSQRLRAVSATSPPRPPSARSRCWPGRAPVPSATTRPLRRPGRTGTPPTLRERGGVQHPQLGGGGGMTPKIPRPTQTPSPHSRSRSRSQRFCHISIMAFLLSSSSISFALICKGWLSGGGPFPPSPYPEGLPLTSGDSRCLRCSSFLPSSMQASKLLSRASISAWMPWWYFISSSTEETSLGEEVGNGVVEDMEVPGIPRCQDMQVSGG